MRGFLLGTALAVAVSTAALAGPGDWSPSGSYLETSYDAWFPKYKSDPDLPTVLNGGDVKFGWRFNRFYAVEFGYSDVTGSGYEPQITVQSFAIDGLGYLPWGRHSRFALYGDIGVAQMQASANYAPNENKFGAHFGGGAQYQINSLIAIRADIRYQMASFYQIDGAAVGTVGLVWTPF